MTQPNQAATQAAYKKMREAQLRMSLIDLQIKDASEVHVAQDLIAQFDNAADAFLAANAELELAGFWSTTDVFYGLTEPDPAGPRAA